MDQERLALLALHFVPGIGDFLADDRAAGDHLIAAQATRAPAPPIGCVM